jgi:uncharacterized protein
MDSLDRGVFTRIIKKLIPNKVIVIIGPRRVGKTVLIKQILEKAEEPYILLNGEDITTIELLQKRSTAHYKRILGEVKLLAIDEAQQIPEIGKILKLMIDEIKGLKIIVSGSSAFDLENRTGEPLTGRKTTFHLFPLAQMEFAKIENLIQTKENLEDRLIFGSYPEIIQYTSSEEKTEYLKEIVNSYLLKDILLFENLRSSIKILNLLKQVAFQVGSEVSMDELGKKVGISKNTVERYLDLLSKVFVIYRLPGFSRNLRSEVTKSSKWYFYDNGIRNALIANLNPLNLRDDIGKLWENYLLSERIKHQHYSGMLVNNYFWRTYQQQEIDLIEEKGGKLYASEFKWNPKAKSKIPSAWKAAYPDATYEVIDTDNYLDWIGA